MYNCQNNLKEQEQCRQLSLFKLQLSYTHILIFNLRMGWHYIYFYANFQFPPLYARKQQGFKIANDKTLSLFCFRSYTKHSWCHNSPVELTIFSLDWKPSPHREHSIFSSDMPAIMLKQHIYYYQKQIYYLNQFNNQSLEI